MNTTDNFDRERNTNTGGLVPLSKLTIDSPNSAFGVHYQASPPDICEAAIRALPIRPEDFCFVDLGAGKGRVLLIASSFPFKRIIGVEFARELADIACKNLRSCSRAEVVCADAALYDFPDDNLVIYMYNPFERSVMEKVMRRLSEAAKLHTILVIYLQPSCADIILRYGMAITRLARITTFKIRNQSTDKDKACQ